MNVEQIMAKIIANNSWRQRHNDALSAPLSGSLEEAVIRMIESWEMYAVAHKARYGSPIGEDYVLGPQWQASGESIRALLKGDIGRLDYETSGAFILQTIEQHGGDISRL